LGIVELAPLRMLRMFCRLAMAKGSELSNCIVIAGAIVGGSLSRYGFVVPSFAPQVLSNATRFFSVWDFGRV